MVELQPEHVHPGEQLEQPVRHLPEVRRDADRPPAVAGVVRPHAERRVGVVRHLHGGDAQPAAQLQPLARLEVGGQAGPVQRPVSGVGGQGVVVLAVGEERDVQPAEVFEGVAVPVVGVRVGDDHRVDGLPVRPDHLQPGGQLLRGQPAIDQQAEPVPFDQGGVAGTAAGQDRHPVRRHGLAVEVGGKNR